MIHIHEGKAASSGKPIINLFPLGSTAFPSGVSPFKIPAGMTYKIAGSFNESALDMALETVGPAYDVAKFVTVSCCQLPTPCGCTQACLPACTSELPWHCSRPALPGVYVTLSGVP